MITNNLKSEFWILTDTHLIADQLHDNGAAFKRMQQTSQGKDLVYQEIALTAFCKMAQEKKPAAIIVTGDLTFNGELISAQKFQEIFSKLTQTKVLVLPGNHDIFDGWARGFKGEKQLFTKQISPYDWREIFKQSYACAFSQDQNSLAYSVQLNPQYLLLMLDSNIYGQKDSVKAPITEGSISEEQIIWLRKQLDYAQEHDLRPLLFMHHNLYVHNPAVNQGFVLNNAAQLRQLCEKYQIKIAFSGHIHAQNIIGPVEKTPTIEVVTSSFCSYDQAYGVVKLDDQGLLYQRKIFDMTPYLTEAELQNQTVANFHEYLKNIQLKNLAGNSSEQGPLSPLERQIKQTFLEINYNYFTGHNHISSAELKKLTTSTEYQTLIQQKPQLNKYLKSLFDTSDHSNLIAKITY
ncbi:metallophosphoesterase [Lactobacillus sp. ESL0681]|uniref:metallophosphoesterase n=1 Tax=Lactobacillus sp. ESL0681 TaxID=2983211 RepID=UPI0023F942AF|nr:metallophosphoesterase [Lactobacillus sp. ESL0681]WEV40679.1 metallophosphoesterase [Lactobacillus sp. ESL0681]